MKGIDFTALNAVAKTHGIEIDKYIKSDRVYSMIRKTLDYALTEKVTQEEKDEVANELSITLIEMLIKMKGDLRVSESIEDEEVAELKKIADSDTSFINIKKESSMEPNADIEEALAIEFRESKELRKTFLEFYAYRDYCMDKIYREDVVDTILTNIRLEDTEGAKRVIESLFKEKAIKAYYYSPDIYKIDIFGVEKTYKRYISRKNKNVYYRKIEIYKEPKVVENKPFSKEVKTIKEARELKEKLLENGYKNAIIKKVETRFKSYYKVEGRKVRVEDVEVGRKLKKGIVTDKAIKRILNYTIMRQMTRNSDLETRDVKLGRRYIYLGGNLFGNVDNITTAEGLAKKVTKLRENELLKEIEELKKRKNKSEVAIVETETIYDVSTYIDYDNTLLMVERIREEIVKDHNILYEEEMECLISTINSLRTVE